MSFAGSVAEWLLRPAGKQGIAGSIPVGGIFFSLRSRSLQLGKAHANEIKNDIHSELWMQT